MNENRDLDRAATVEEARDAILCVLVEDYPTDIWGDALGAAVASLMNAKIDAEGVRLEDNARRALE